MPSGAKNTKWQKQATNSNEVSCRLLFPSYLVPIVFESYFSKLLMARITHLGRSPNWAATAASVCIGVFVEHSIERWTRQTVFVPRPITHDIGPIEVDAAISILAFGHKFRSPVGLNFLRNGNYSIVKHLKYILGVY